MDPVTLFYYAAICGALSLASPALRGRGARFAAGIAIGLIAATLLPPIRASLGL